jgi:hypothetical protein
MCVICPNFLESSLQYEKMDNVSYVLLPNFKLSPFQGLKSPSLPWFESCLGLLLHRSNIRSYSKPPVPSSEPPKQGIKWRLIFEHDRRAHSPRPYRKWHGSEFLVSIAEWLKNIHARFQVHSCYGSKDIGILNKKLGNVRYDPFLISCPVTYYNFHACYKY